MRIGLLLAHALPPGESLFWSMPLTNVEVVADALAAAAYLAVPITLYRSRHEPRPRVGLLIFGTLVSACGLSHLLALWPFGPAAYAVAVGVRTLLAGAAVAMAACLVRRQAARPRRAMAVAQEQPSAALADRVEELTRANTALQASELMFRTFMDNSPALAWVTDGGGVYRYVSRSFQQRYQRLGNLVGRRIEDLFPAEFAQKYLADNRQVTAQQRLLEFAEPNEDGSEYQVFKFPLRDGDGPGLIGGIAFDNTEQRRIRESLRQQSALQGAMGEAMRVYLESGDWQQTFGLLLRCALQQTQSEYGFAGVVLERQRLRVLAHAGEEWSRHVSREFRQPAAPEVREVDFGRLEPPLPRALRDGEIVVVEPAPDGASDGPRGSFLVVPILRERQVVGLMGVGRSTGRYGSQAPGLLAQVTQQAGVLCDSYRRGLRETSLEEQLRASQKMEAIGMLAGGVAHDFNNLLQVIQGYTGIALDASATWPERRSSLEQVRHASERAAQLTQQLLAFGRRQNLQQADLDLNSAIRDLLRMIRRLIGEQITVDFIPGHELGNVHADRAQIDQVLLNLCLNSRDALPHGGRITIETENVLVNGTFRESHPWAKPGRYVLMTVSDNGVGMDRETTARIFEPFFTTKSKEKGTGLGLSVVYGVVKQHEGMVHVYSEPDKGTTFKIYLPSVARVASAVGPKHTPAHPRGSETILLAEDEPMVRELAQRILTRAGYRVVVACDGGEACTMFAQRADEIALAILDVVMPQLGGREVYERIAQLRPGLPVIFCSGYAGSALGLDALGLNGGRLLAKPYGADEMLESVRSALDHR